MQLFAPGRLRVPAGLCAVVVCLVGGGAAFAAASAQASPFIARGKAITTVASAVPASGPAAGEVNPYGVAVVSTTIGGLVRGDVLVSNFNNAANQQGTGTSIVEISPSGAQHVFAVLAPPTATPAMGLTTALVALRSGYVVVGSLPAPGGMFSAATAGALTVLDPSGHVVKTITASDINGPWDMTAVDRGARATLFVTNVLNGTVAAGGGITFGGAVVRIRLAGLDTHAPAVVGNRVIADGFAEHTDPGALVVGPTGVGIGSSGVLYVADSVSDRIAAVPNALNRTVVLHNGAATLFSGGRLNDPLGLLVAPNGDIVTANGADGAVVETTPSGTPAGSRTLVPNGAGDLFGLAVAPDGIGMYFVNDSGTGAAANSLQLLR